jgi:hypothetical protein
MTRKKTWILIWKEVMASFLFLLSCASCVSWLDKFHGVGGSEVAVVFVDLGLEAAKGFVLEGDVGAECGVPEEILVRCGLDGGE